MYTQLIKLIVLAGLLLSGSVAMAQDTAATIPVSFVGTYDLTYSKNVSSTATQPFAEGSKVPVTVLSGNQLCVNGTLLGNPVIRNGNGHEAIWKDTSTNQEFALSSIIDGFNEINVSNNGTFSTFLGQLRGTKTSDVTSACVAAAPTLATDAANVLTLAESIYASLFGTGNPLKVAQGYTYRFYPTSGIYVGFKDGKVFVVGGPFGDKILEKGPVATVTTALNNAKIKIDAKANGNGGTTIGGGVVGTGGNWDLTINGTATTTVAGFKVPVTLSAFMVKDLQLINPASQSEVEQVIKDAYKDIGAISNLKVVIINNTSSNVKLSVAYSAIVVSSGVSVNTEYDMTYEFVKK